MSGLFVPRTIRTLDYSYYRWTVRTLDDSYDGLFVRWTIGTMDFLGRVEFTGRHRNTLRPVFFITTIQRLVIFSVKIHVKLSHDSLFAVKIFIDFSEN